MSIEIINGLDALKKTYPNLVLTIGNFDGIHIGHQKIMKKVVGEAKAHRGTSMAMSFEPHPVKVISPESNLTLLTPTLEKARIMGLMGIEKLLLINFSREFASLGPDEFIEKVLLEKLRPRVVIVGHNYAFGKAKRGTTALLRRRGVKYGFRLIVVRNAKLGGHVVSSSRTRLLLEKGRVAEAARLLGRAYMIEGEVVRGAGRGARLLGFPTANIETPHELIPREGVYAVKVRMNGKPYKGVLNIGMNPTFGNSKLTCETYIMDFSGDLLGSEIRVYFIERIRSEEKFPSPQALKEAIEKDVKEAERVFSRVGDRVKIL